MKKLDLKYKDGTSIFEGDQISILIGEDKEKGELSFSQSNFSKLCNYYKVDEVKIKILDSESYLQLKYEISFYKLGDQIITIQENEYWSHIEDCEHDKNLKKESFESFESLENYNLLFNPINESVLFFNYLVGKGLTKSSVYNDRIDLNEVDVKYKIKSMADFDIFIGDVVTIELNEEIKERIESIHSDFKEELRINDYSHLSFNFISAGNNFNYFVDTTLTNEVGVCQVFLKDLKEEVLKTEEYKAMKRSLKKAKERFYNKEDDLEKQALNEKDLLNANKEIESFYDKDENIVFSDYNPCFGMNDDIDVLNYSIKAGVSVKKQ